jgi:siroheme decarboxylase
MLSEFDKRLLNIIQSDIPLTSRPFAVIASRIGADEATVIESLNRLKQEGYIRRIGPFFDSERLGYVSTLIALKVDESQLPAVAEAVNACPGVTHNYEREASYNLWFTLLSPDRAAEERTLSRLAGLPGVLRMLNLPATRKYKVNVQFTLE